MVVVPQEVAARALKLSKDRVAELSGNHQERSAEHARAMLLAFGVLRQLYPACSAIGVARALGYAPLDVRRVARRYSIICSQQRRREREDLPHWHSARLELRLVEAMRRGESAREPDFAFARPAHASSARVMREPGLPGKAGRRVVVEIFERPRVAAVSGARE